VRVLAILNLAINPVTKALNKFPPFSLALPELAEMIEFIKNCRE
jgi:hypothetical protein